MQLVAVKLPPVTTIAGLVMERTEFVVAGTTEMEVSERLPELSVYREVVRTDVRLRINEILSKAT